MRRERHRFWLTGILIGSAIAFTAYGLARWVPRIEAAGGPTAERAKEVLSQVTGVPAELFTVVNTAPLADTGIMRFKLRDAEGKIHRVNLDALGNPVTNEEVERAIQEFNNRGFVGKLEAELADLLTRADPDRPIRVGFWLKGTMPRPVRSMGVTREEDEANVQTVRAQIAAIQTPVVNQLRAMGQRVIYQAQSAPVVVAAATPSAIRAMEARPDVERIYLERLDRPSLNRSRVVVQADLVNARGITGAGMKVGVVEAHRIGTHPNLPEVQRTLCRDFASSMISDHKTRVAGVIQSTEATFGGMAPAITIIDGIAADFTEAELMNATDCVIAAGADVVNMSFFADTDGVFDMFSRYVEGTVYLEARTIVVSGGNTCALRIGSPAIAFNALAVGAFGDNNTVDFADDVPPCTAPVTLGAFLNPISANGDREEPDVVAPGHLIATTDAAGGFTDDSGTSFAAPHVAGGVGLLAQRQPQFFAQPEEMRAIMMASARHNLEGDSRLSDRDGAGGIMLAAADSVKLNNRSGWFADRTMDQAPCYSVPFITLSAGDRVRATIAWAHKSPWGDTETEPTADFDLSVLLGIQVLAQSQSFDNNYEIVEFIAPETADTYELGICGFRRTPGDEFIGWGVSRSDT